MTSKSIENDLPVKATEFTFQYGMAAIGRNCIKISRWPIMRYYSTPALVNVQINDTTGMATVIMNRAPANSLSLELVTELNQTLRDLEKARCRGVILTSALPTIFSAGIDIMEMYKPDMKRAREYWTSLQELWLTLYALGLPSAAAINGASPAGGCLLAMSCEYRVFVQGKHTMGLNETKLGLVAPRWFQDTLINTIGHRRAEKALLQGALYAPDEALQIGLVDELADDKADAIVKCEKYISTFATIPVEPRSITKLGMRKAALSWLQDNRKMDVQIFLSFLEQPQVQQGLGAYLKGLQSRSR